MSTAPPPADHDSRDWTFVVDDGCDECGYTPHDPAATSDRLLAAVPRWAAALQRPGASERPAPGVWSPLEYACHARDLVRVLGDRVSAVLAREGAPFADYDGEAEAVRQEFWASDPRVVARQVAEETERTVAVLDRVRGQAWGRAGTRGDGAPFTIAGLCRYLLHDVEHHLHDAAA